MVNIYVVSLKYTAVFTVHKISCEIFFSVPVQYVYYTVPVKSPSGRSSLLNRGLVQL